MGRNFLEKAGFDPDEPLDLSTKVQCGARVRWFFITNHGMPADQQTVQGLVDETNAWLRMYGRPGDAVVADIQAAIQFVQAENQTR